MGWPYDSLDCLLILKFSSKITGITLGHNQSVITVESPKELSREICHREVPRVLPISRFQVLPVQQEIWIGSIFAWLFGLSVVRLSHADIL